MILVVPGGDAHTYPISHGTESFEPYRADKADPNSLWLVDVPGEVAVHLLHNAGFFMYHDESGNSHSGEPPKVRLKHPAGLGCGWNGVAYEPDADGVVEVPAPAAADLKWHGFEAAPAVKEAASAVAPSATEQQATETETRWPAGSDGGDQLRDRDRQWREKRR
jgi:hypothetical protein